MASSERGENASQVDLSKASIQNFQKDNECSSLKDDNNTASSEIVGGSSSKLKSSGGVLSSCQKSLDVNSDFNFVFPNPEDAIWENAFTEVMHKMHSKHYNISEEQELLIYDKCKLLFEKDYICKVVNNCNYTMNYPVRIIVPVGKKSSIEGPSMDFDVFAYSKLLKETPRRRNRFVTPAILFDNKFICRSGALSVKLSTLNEITQKMVPPRTVASDEDARDILKDHNIATSIFKTDVEIVEHQKIQRIFDMTTNHYNKICQPTVSFITSEKDHLDLYRNVKVEEIPYSGCNKFDCYHKAGRNLRGLDLDWKEMDAARTISLTEDPKVFFPEINVDDHTSWDLIKLTQNYLKIMLSHLVTDTGGMVIHCASGWDRTPLFVTLLRLSLWADGVVHESLGFQEITYLTIAYDWFLFGHKFPDRFRTHSEIMHFCFNFLECIISDEFSVTRLFQELPAEKKRNRVFPRFLAGRRTCLNKIRALFLKMYDEEIIKKK